jgi:nucleoside phosphorylase
MVSPPPRREEFEVAIFCAMATEYDAVTLLVDDLYENGRFYKAPGDKNLYKLGRMGDVNIVLLRLAEAGKRYAGTAAANLRTSYPELKMLVLTGVCGGVPSTAEGQELLLGDVVISKSIVEYDNGKQYTDAFVIKKGIEDSLGRPTKPVRNLIALLEVEHWHIKLESQAACYLEQLQAKASLRQRESSSNRKSSYNYPGTASDRLYESSYLHKHQLSTPHACAECHDSICVASRSLSCGEVGCSDTHTIPRLRLESKRALEHRGLINKAQAPAVVFGCYGSADTVMRSEQERDRLAREHNIVAIEMEGAGLWEELPCIIVKGVSDYADGHKDDTWQPFAAATAAAVTKALLVQHIQDVLNVAKPQDNGGQSAGRAGNKLQKARQMPKDRNFEWKARCYRCDCDNHTLRDCYAKEYTVEKGRRIRFQENRCLNCGEEDHYQASCRWEDLLPRRREYRYR